MHEKALHRGRMEGATLNHYAMLMWVLELCGRAYYLSEKRIVVAIVWITKLCKI